MLKTFLCAIVFAGLASAQPVIAGLKVGVPLTDAFHEQSFTSSFGSLEASSGRYTIGPYVEVRLPLRFSVEVDALYRGSHFATATGSVSKSSWEFPMLAKYKLLPGPVKPFVDGGISFSHLSDAEKLIVAQHASNFGVVLGAGVEIKALVMRISPEIRYTGDALRNFGGLIQSNRNQLVFMVGIGF